MKPMAAALMLGLLMANASDVSSCGPFLPIAVFERMRGPDDEHAFLGGQLGILRSTYERRYLVMAYRILNGNPPGKTQLPAVTSDLDDQVKQWVAARKEVKSADPLETVEVYQRADNFTSKSMCGSDAFATARKTLEERIGQAGADSPEVKDWLYAQDRVFLSCAGGDHIPDAAPQGSSARELADRAYQIAAAYFYAGNFDEARKRWREIAADAQSSWHLLAPYLVARAYLREEKYKEAETQIQTVLADKSEAALYPQARRLLDFARAQIDPQAQLLALSNRLMEPNPVDLPHDLNDYTFLVDRFESGFSSEFAPGATEDRMIASTKKRWDRFNEVAAQSDLTAWIGEFQNKMVIKHDELQRWQKMKSLPWLLAAGKWDEADALDALTKVPSSSPAYATARFEAAQILTEKNRTAEAANLLDAILEHSAEAARFDNSTLNSFHEERMAVAQTFDDFLRNAPRSITFIENEDEQSKPGPSFDVDAAAVFNLQMPVSLWRKAVSAPALRPNLKASLAQSGLVRTIVLGHSPSWFAAELSTLKPAYAFDLAPIARLQGEEQRFASVFWMLHHPELSPNVDAGVPRNTPDGRIDNYRRNWWCGDSEQPRKAVLFLSALDRKEGAEQASKIKSDADAASFLASIAVAWANAHPTDERNAEALALAVKSSHYSCSRTSDEHAVEHAFHLLHERYPKTKWADMTPYWY